MAILVTWVLPMVASVVVIRVLTSWSWGRCRSTKSQEGRLFIVTGANSGLGKETVRMLAKLKARVVMACRDMAAAQVAIEDIRRSTPDGELIPMQLDLASLESVHSFAQRVLKEFPQIHVLINNAGLSIPDDKKTETEHGLEVHFAVNYLGHFFLTELLLDRLKGSAPSRIVNVSSLLHRHGVINFDHLSCGSPPSTAPKSRRLPPAYGNSKLCNVYHTMELGERLKGSEVDVYTLCPGWCYSGLMRHFEFPWYRYLAIIPIAFLFMRSASTGAQGIVHCAVEDKLEKNYGTFGFYRNCRPFTSPVTLDPEIARKLWDYSDKLTKEKAPNLYRSAMT